MDMVLNSGDHRGSTPLHMAAREGHIEIVKELLVEAGEKPGAACAEDNLGCVPLHFGAQYGHLEVVKLLIKADPKQIEASQQAIVNTYPSSSAQRPRRRGETALSTTFVARRLRFIGFK